jgi:hypothetical protein
MSSVNWIQIKAKSSGSPKNIGSVRLLFSSPTFFCNSFTRLSIVPIENIKELRTASDARYYRELFQISQECENRWLTVIYTLDGRWKLWHVVAPSIDVFQMWDSTLRKLHAIRQALMCGLGNNYLREFVWEKQYWKAADEQADQKLYLEDVEKLCRRLNVNPSHEQLHRRFNVRPFVFFVLQWLIASPASRRAEARIPRL